MLNIFSFPPLYFWRRYEAVRQLLTGDSNFQAPWRAVRRSQVKDGTLNSVPRKSHLIRALADKAISLYQPWLKSFVPVSKNKICLTGKFDFSHLVSQVRETFLCWCVKLSLRVLLKLETPVFNSKNINTSLHLGVHTWEGGCVALTCNRRQ